MVFLLFVLGASHAQEVGDFRSVGSGNWTDSGNWETYNGTAWVAATNYPGEVPGTNDVYIIGGATIDLGSSIPSAIAGLFVGDGTGGTDTLRITNTASLNTPLLDLQTGGFAIWAGNHTFTLPSGAVFKISGGTLDDGNPCSAAKRLVIGSQIYSTCNGGAGADYSFEDLNTSGGSLSVSPSSDSPICEGDNLNLFANPSGAGSSGASFSWVGSGPGSYSFSSSDQDPVVSGLVPGNYSFTVTITETSGFNTSASVSTEVLPGVAITAQPTNQQGVTGSNLIFTVTTSGTPTYQWQVSTNGGGAFTDLSDGSKYSGSQTNTLQVSSLQISDNTNLFRVQVQPASGSCPPVISNSALLTVVVPTVLSNRRITYRVNQ
ncbi:immunoglobulin domain-containing protein [Robiginitalea sp.]|uniref:immunoglobulin domain-containing protein n=1 Tax=Robiginitalea sp. TaxID=1902411 RepID=UPI003C72B129